MQARFPRAAVVYLSSPHRTSAAQLVHMDRLAPLWGPGPTAAVAAEDSAYLAARQAFAAAVQTASLKARPFPLKLRLRQMFLGLRVGWLRRWARGSRAGRLRCRW